MLWNWILRAGQVCWSYIWYLKNADLHPKLDRLRLKIATSSNIYEIWHLVEIEHANHEYGTWNWWFWTKIIGSGKFCPSTEICSDFYEILHSQQMEHANYEYNTSHGLERSRDYWLRMIIGFKIWLSFWTGLIALTPR